MNKQTPTAASTPSSALPARFDLRGTGLSDAQLKSIAGARPVDKTGQPTSPPVTKCCW